MVNGDLYALAFSIGGVGGREEGKRLIAGTN